MRQTAIYSARLFRQAVLAILQRVTCCALIASAAFATQAEASSPRTVTLVTGDQVVVDSDNSRTLKPRARSGGKRVSFMTRSSPGARGSSRPVYVIPSDAVPLLTSGKLDQELFNVTVLLESHFDDQHRPDLPLILTYQSQSSARIAASAKLAGLSQTRALLVVSAVAAKPSVEELGRFWDALVGSNMAASSVALNDGLKKVWLDAALKPMGTELKPLGAALKRRPDRMRALLDGSVRQIGAHKAWEAGYEGTGVRVAVVDTGIDPKHPDLAGKVIAAADFSGDGILGDIFGYGTHEASIIAGSGAASGGQYRGVAPGALLISAKFCGFVEDTNCLSSNAIAAMEWAVVEQGAKIVNFPFDYIGHIPGASPRPLGELVNRLTESHGVLVAAGVGDFGPLPIINGVGPIGPPCVADAALCVAAVDRADQTAPFSAVAPPLGEQIKPDISAPGVEITAALATDLPYGPFGTPVDENYTTVSSTAMATAHVAGAAALLSERYPNLTGAQLKALLMGSARSTPTTPIIEQGTGRVDVAAAFAAAVFAEPGSLPFGTALWPHDDDPGITRDVTFRNISDTATTLTFRFEVSGPDGNAAPEGLFSINTTSLTIPANGSASVRVTANMRIGTTYGVFIGKLIASSTNGSSFPIPVSVHREVESYNLKLVNLDSEGQPALFAHQFIRTDAEWPVTSGADSGELKVRLPKGRYNIDSAIFSSGPPALMMYPALLHDADRILTFDAREAQALEPIAPTATSSLLNAQFRYVVRTDFGAEHESLFLEYPPRMPPFLVATFGESAKGLRSDLNLQWTDPAAASGSKQESDSVYSGAWVTQGRLISGGPRALPRDKLSVVRATFASAFPEVTAATAAIAVVNSNGSRGFSIPLPIVLPSKRTEYYYSENDIRWKSIVMLEANENLTLESADNRYLAGRSYSQRWNEPPFSPAFPEKNVRERYVRRSGDILWVDLPLYGDRGGHAGSIGEYAIKLCLAEECVECIAPNCGGFRLPPELATYRLEGLETQSAYPLSTEVHGAWMFDSAYVSTGEQVKPLLSISIRPALNESGKAPRGTLRVPLSVHEVGNRGTADVSEVTVQASFDDGASWQKMPVSRVGKEWAVEMSHPQKGDYVSLRMSAQGTGNNRVEETIVRAYGLVDATSR